MPGIRVRTDVDFEVNIDVYCGTCGKGLCNDVTVDDRRMSFTVNVCQYCMEEKEDRIKELEEEVERLESKLL